MSVVETRARVIIDSKSAQAALDALSRSMSRFDNALVGAGPQFKNVSSGIKVVNADMQTLTKSIGAAEAGLTALKKFGSAINTVVGGAFKYTTSLESNVVGISGILTSMTKVNGKTLEWNQALGMSNDIMEKLRKEALKTASTAPELLETFRALLGPGLGAGMKIDEVMKLTTVGVNAVKSMGLNGTQLVQELRDLVQGGIRPASSTLATALGLTDADIKREKASADGLYKFLMDRLKGFEMSVGATSRTIQGRLSILEEGLYQSIEIGAVKSVDFLREKLKDLSEIVIRYNYETQKMEINPDFVKQVEKISSAFNTAGGYVSKFVNLITDHLGVATKILIEFLGYKLIVGGIGLLVNGARSFADTLLAAGNTVIRMRQELFKVIGFEDSIAIKENEILNTLREATNQIRLGTQQYQERLKAQSDIAKLDKDIVDLINQDYKYSQNKTKELEKQQRTYREINSLLMSANTNSVGINARNINMAAKNANLDSAQAAQLAQRYINIFQKSGQAAADEFARVVQSRLPKVFADMNLKNILAKNGVGVTGNEYNVLSAYRNVTANNSGNLNAQTLTSLKELDKAYFKLSETMKRLGMTENEVTREIVRLNGEIIKSNGQVVDSEIKKAAQQAESLRQDLEANSKRKSILDGLTVLGGALTTLGVTYKVLAGDTETSFDKMVEWASTAGMVIGAAGQIGTAFRELTSIVKELNIMLLLKNVLQLGAAHPGIAAALGLAAIGTGFYFWSQGQEGHGEQLRAQYELQQKYSPIVDKMTYSDAPMEDDVAAMEAMNKAAKEAREKAYAVKNGNVTTANTAGFDEKAAKKAERERKAAEALAKRIADAKASYGLLAQTIDIANGKLTGSYTKYNEELDSATKKTDEWKKSLVDLVVKAGGAIDKDGKITRFGEITEEQYNKAISAMQEYKRLKDEEIAREKKKQGFENELQHIQNLQELGELATSEANKRREETLRSEIAFLENQYNLYKDDADKRMQIETELHNKKKALREAESTDMKIHWDNVLKHIKNTTFDQTAVVKSTFDSMLGSFTNFGQNLLTENKKLSDRVRDLFYDFANSIINMMMKMIMQGLAMQAILGIGNLFGKTPTTTSYGKTLGTDLSKISMAGRSFAKGGVANGWALVGEQGPELVNFSSPGRVYTAQQTRNALSGGNGGNVNIKFDIKNESGTPVEAQQTGSSFDGETYIVGVVLKAINSNKYGARTILKGAMGQ